MFAKFIAQCLKSTLKKILSRREEGFERRILNYWEYVDGVEWLSSEVGTQGQFHDHFKPEQKTNKQKPTSLTDSD